MHSDDVVDHPGEFRTNRPAHHHRHFGAGLHQCFGRFANVMAIPTIAKPLLRRDGLTRTAGELVKVGPYPAALGVTYRA